MKSFLNIAFLSALLYSCSSASNTDQESSAFDRIEDEKARTSLEKSINNAGGISNWRNLKELNFEKTSILFFEDGSVEDSTHKIISFSFNPFQASISWIAEGDRMNLLFRNDSTFQLKNDSLSETNNENHRSSVMSTLYTLGMPYKLLDEGTQLSYVGIDTLSGTTSDVIMAGYNSSTNKNHTSSEIWWYYFGSESGKFVGSKVYHPPTYAYIENESFEKAGALKFPGHRLSYRVDSLGNKQFLRGEFFYKNFTSSY